MTPPRTQKRTQPRNADAAPSGKGEWRRRLSKGSAAAFPPGGGRNASDDPAWRLLHNDSATPHSLYEKGRLRLDADAYEMWVDGCPVTPLPREFQLLCFFVRSPNRVFDRVQIVARVWPEATAKRIDPRTVDVHVYRLRRYLERDPAHPKILVTVRGVGWKFNDRALSDAPRPIGSKP